jgi:excisionase family DNA binding protein
LAKQVLERPLAVTVEQAGRLLGISRNLAYQLARERKIPTVKLGRRLLVPIKELEKLLEVKEG